jgi:cytolysin-activating lysine-acyltransferase
MTKAATAGKRADAPLLGEAALQEALAGFGASPGANTYAATAQAQPAPKTVAQVLGEIAWLMTLLMPALLLRQFRIFYKGEQPVGVAVWALADDLVAQRIDAGDRRLTAVEWKSGSNLRIIELVAPFGGEAEMREQILQSQISA